ncbi:caspase family protein [Rhizobium leguminosarum]|uniref:caspase family protein n=1 Tax=Rhizobium leguminosarum TaxID=384 RepID=UPI001F1E035C|nr:caspase family protein [Rhizobium leguminosarum]UIK20669.1 caspase family protein [Rhizobium leguminosarum]
MTRLWLLLATLCLFLIASIANTADKPSMYILMVGINHYGKPVDPAYGASDLNGPKNDIDLFKALLIDTYRMPNDSDHIRILLDQQATHAKIAAAFKEQLVEKAKRDPNSVFVFYFSGHGSLAFDDNGDEGDGYDETLVAYDSRSAGGSDIRDDEIETWINELKTYSQNIVLIMDACHSGTISKAPGLIARRAPIDDRQKPAGATLASPKQTKPGALDGSEKAVSIISGSMAEEVSNEDVIETKDGKRYHGLMTYGLVQSLEHDPILTYRQATTASEQFVHRRAPSQHPQAEGDIERIIFGGIGERQTPYIPVSQVQKDGISVGAGESQGVQVGALLAVYSASAKKLEGETDKIAEAVVTESGISSSKARFVSAPKQPVSTKAKVRIISPYSSGQKLRIALKSPTGEYRLDSTTAQSIRDRMKNSALVTIVDDQTTATMYVGSACLAEGVPIPPTGCTQSLFVSTADQDKALHDFSTPIEPNAVAAASVARALESFARQENLRTLTNNASPLSVDFTFIAVDVQIIDGHGTIAGQTPVNALKTIPVKVKDSFQFQVTNKSEQDLYYSIIALGSSGGSRSLPMYLPAKKCSPARPSTRNLFCRPAPLTDLKATSYLSLPRPRT